MALRYGPTAAAMSRESCSTSEMSRSAAVVDPDLSCVVRIAWTLDLHNHITLFIVCMCAVRSRLCVLASCQRV